MKRKIFIVLIVIGFIAARFSIEKHEKKRSAVISVYIHGTLFNWRNFLACIPGASHLTYVPDGITSVNDLEQDAVAYKIAEDFSAKDPKRFVFDNFYAFGWSGHLSFTERKKSAEFLAQELQKLVMQYYEVHGYKPIVRLITFSHGGNVALNLAHFLPKDLSVELVLIACPVQSETEELIHADCFTKIYTIASLNDVLQVSDPLNMYRNLGSDKWLSKRFFNADMSKLKQACVSVNGTYLGHLELFNVFNQHIPMVLNRLDVLPAVKGNAIAYIDIQDKDFPFLNGMNIVDVLNGKRHNCKV